jgi:hypothetical protein
MKKCLYLVAILALLLQLLLFFLPAASAQEGGNKPLAPTDQILYVSPGGNGTCTTSWSNACELQTALGAAVSDDEIWVQAGTYKPTTGSDRTVSFALTDGVAVYGGFTGTEISRKQRNWVTNVTTLSGDIGTAGNISDNSYHVVTGSGTSTTTILDGFTISGGNANTPDLNHLGGGMYNVNGSPTLTNVILIGNIAWFGGGMYNQDSNPTLVNVTFSENNASFGGGMRNLDSSPTLANVIFSSNAAMDNGGGMYNESGSPTLANVTFSGNTANNNGAGMHNLNSSPTLTNVIFSDNTARNNGGGMFSHYGSPRLTGVTFSGNIVTQRGGGMYNQYNNPILANVIFSGNTASSSGGGIFNLSSSPTLANVTFYGNMGTTGGGMSNSSSNNITMANAILWGNTPDQIFNSSSTPMVTYSDVQGGYTGTGNLNADPQFVRNPSPGGDGQWGTPDDDYGDLRLQLTSPAIDAGDNAAVPSGIVTDLLGFPRFIDIASVPDTGSGTPPIVDMGAYEAQVLVYLPVLQK